MKAKILVADDSVTIQKIVTMSFENEDIDVVGVDNGKQAFDKMYEVRPDIVLADTDMPGLTGYQLSKKIKDSKEFGSVKILLLTSDFGEFNEELYKDCRADGHISKPFKSDEIVKKVNELLGSGQSPDEPELLSLSVMDIVDDTDLPQAIILEEDAIVPAQPGIAGGTSSKTSSAKPEDEFNFDNIFDDSFAPAETASAPESAGKPDVDPVFEDTASFADMVKEIEGMGWPEAGELRNDTAASAGGDASLFEKAGDTGIFDKMVDDLEKLKWQETEPPAKAEKVEREPEDPDFLAETSETKVEPLDELDSVFNELKSAEPADKRFGISKRETVAKPKLKNVEPEPDDLLEKMAPSAFSRQSESKPDLIKESLAFLSERKTGNKNGKSEQVPDQPSVPSPALSAAAGDLNLVLGDQISAILEKSLGTAIKGEVAGLSDVILQSVREVVREVTPQIAREIIREEIEKIRALEDR